MRIAAVLAFSALLSPLAESAATAPGPVAAARQQVEAADYNMTGRLVRVDEKGKRTSYGVAIKAHYFPGVLRVLMAVNSPADARVHVLMEMRPGEKNTVLLARPGAPASPLSFDRWDEEPLGESFTYEDLLEAHNFWTGQALLGQATFGARTCELVRSVPGASDRTHFAEVKSWLDQKSSFPVHVEKTVKGTGTVKEFTYSGVEQRQGVWIARQVEATVHGKSGSVLLIIDHGTPKAHLSEKDFSPTQLTHF